MPFKTSQYVVTWTPIRLVGPAVADRIVVVAANSNAGLTIGPNERTVVDGNGFLLSGSSVHLNLARDEELWARCTGNNDMNSTLYIIEMEKF